MTDNGLVVSLDELIGLRVKSHALRFLKPSTVYTEQSGGFTSSFRGRGMDFEETRIYQSGDDIRTMDWRVTARTGVAHTKVFRQEKERPIFIVIDYSASLFFGTKLCLKSVTATKAAALIAWAAVAQGDKIGGIIAAPQKYIQHLPKGRTQGVLPLLKTLQLASNPYHREAFTTNLAGTLKRLQQVARPGSLIFLLSDFHTLDAEAEKILTQLAKQQEIVASYVYDPLEKNPPLPNHYKITNGHEILSLNTSSKDVRKAYHEQFNQHEMHLKNLCRSLLIPILTLSTEDDILKTLNQEMRLHG